MRNRTESDRRQTTGAQHLFQRPALFVALSLWLTTFAPDLASAAKPPSQLFCVDSGCTGVISTAITTSKYLNQEKFLLPFHSNTKVRVIAKPVDPKEEYWGVELNGAFGFVPKIFLRESGIHARAKHLVEIDDFLTIMSKLTDDNRHRRSKKDPVDNTNKIADNEEDTEEDDEDEDLEVDSVDESTKPPSRRHKRTSPSYRDEEDNDDYIVDESTKPPSRKHKRNEPSHRNVNNADNENQEGDLVDESTKPSPRKDKRTDPSYRNANNADDENQEGDLVDESTKPPSRKDTRTDPSYRNENNADNKNPESDIVDESTKSPPNNYNITDPLYQKENYPDVHTPGQNKQHSDDLQLSTTTMEPIVSSALPESNPNTENISASPSITIIEGTTIYHDSITSEEEHNNKTPNKVENIEENATVTESNIEENKNIHKNENEKQNISSIPTPETFSLEENSSVDNVLSNNLEPKKATYDVLHVNEDSNAKTTENNEEQKSSNFDAISTTNNEVKTGTASDEANANIYNITTVGISQESNSNINVENTLKTIDDPSDISFIKKDATVEQKTESENNNSNFVNSTLTTVESSEINIANEIPIELIINDEVLSNIPNTAPIENSNLNTETDESSTNSNKIGVDEFPTETVAASNDNVDSKNLRNIENEVMFEVPPIENEVILEVPPIENEVILEVPSFENSGDQSNTLNSNESDIPETVPSSKELENDAPFYNIPRLNALMSPPINTNLNQEVETHPHVLSDAKYAGVEIIEEKSKVVLNDQPYEPQSYKPISTTIATETFDSKSGEDPPLPVSTTETNMFDYKENFGDSDQKSNLLNSNIENEKSFFSSPLILLHSMYESISNIFKSDIIANTVEKANTNVFNTEDINSNDYKQQYENSQHSKRYISMLTTETSQCSAEEKSLPSLSDISTDFIFWLIISAISVLMFTLGYYYLENRKQDGKLLAMVNSLQKELLCSSKECIILKEELTITKDKLIGIEDNSFGADEMVACLRKELVDSQQVISDMQEKINSAEEELANSTEAALELQSILDDQLSIKDTSSVSLGFTITNLQSQLDDQQTTMNLIKAQLAAKVEENELQLLKIMDANNKSASIEKQLKNTQDSLKQAIQENENKSQQLQELASNLEKSLLQAEIQKNTEVKELQLLIKDLKDELNTTMSSLKASSHEVLSLRDNIKMLNMDEKNISAILDVSHTKAELVKVTSEKSSLIEKFEAESALVADLNKKIESQNMKILEIKEQLHDADQKTLQSTTRLEVLTNYFNQKEADLLKELSTKESLWISQQGEAMSTVDKIQSLQQEIQQHKETSESIRREVVEQEAAWRAKVAALEQRSHDHWLARRASERSAEASAREAQTLRQRLAAPSPDKRVVSPLTTGESLPDPTFLPSLGALGGMLPPPPLGFLPPHLGGPMMLPPPLPPHRPPPLGRLSSPPPLQSMRQDRYSPDSRYSPERGYSPQQRGRSPFTNSEARRRSYNNRRYDERYYDSEEDRRSRRYETETDFSPVNTLPPSPIPNTRNHKGNRSGSGQSSDSLEKFK